MSVVTQDRGTIVAAGRVILVDEDTAEVRARGVRSYIVEGAGFLSFELEQPLDVLEGHVMAKRNDNAGGEVTAVVEPVTNRVFFYCWDAAGALDKSAAFYFEISRVVGGATVATEAPVP